MLVARRDPLGISAWRSVAHRILVRVESPFIQHWFKNRLPPSPTRHAGFHVGCEAKLPFLGRARPQKVGRPLATKVMPDSQSGLLIEREACPLSSAMRTL